MAAAAAAGLYPNIEEAQNAMGSGFERVYEPIPENAEKYQEVYKKYSKLCDLIEHDFTD